MSQIAGSSGPRTQTENPRSRYVRARLSFSRKLRAFSRKTHSYTPPFEKKAYGTAAALSHCIVAPWRSAIPEPHVQPTVSAQDLARSGIVRSCRLYQSSPYVGIPNDSFSRGTYYRTSSM